MTKSAKEELDLLIPAISDEELEQAAGGMRCGWICTYTLDCDWSTFGCAC